MSNLTLNKWLQFCFLLLFLSYSKNGEAYSKGPPIGYTGQPPEQATCALSNACHIADVSDDAGIEILIEGDPAIFKSGETYAMTIKVTDPFLDCYGFQIGVQFEDDRSSGGDFELPEGAIGYEVVNAGSYKYIRHTAPSSSGIWNFEWTAPSDNRGSNIIFYAAGIAAICDGNPNSDATYLTTKTISSSCGGISINENVNGNVVDIFCDYTEIKPRTALNIKSITGGTAPYTIRALGSGLVSETTVNDDEPFTYFFGENDVLEQTVGFEVSDETGNICSLDDETISGLVVFFEQCNRPCSSPIELSFKQGVIDEFSCNEALDISININTIQGGDGLYHLSTLGFGTLSNETVSSSAGFTYSFNLEDAVDKTVGFVVNDQNGCVQQFDYTQNIPYDELQNLCKQGCTSDIKIEVVGGLNEPEIICIDDNPYNIMYYIDVLSVSGGTNDNYTIETDGGNIEAISNNIAEGFIYTFTQQVVDDEEAVFAVNASDLCVETFNFNNYFSSVALEELCVCAITGCLDETACNYNPMACIEDGSCQSTGCNPGCTDVCAPNYNSEADEDDGSCEPYDIACNSDCMLGDIQEWDTSTCNCTTISESIAGCTDEKADNYNPNANCNDGNCTYSEPGGCTDVCAPNYNSEADEDDGSCEEYDTTCNSNCAMGDIEVWDTVTCACIVTDICDETNCETSAGELRPIQFDTFCTLSAMVTLPVQFGYNINLEYIFLITNQNLEIAAQSSDFRTNLTGLPAGEYCIYGMSYDANNAPDLNVGTMDELLEQNTACFSITRDCVPLTILAETTNPNPPVGPSDTLFYCTGYTVPIDFCIDLSDEDGGEAYLVDIISFCNPSIEGNNCVHYPPLPGLLVGDTEVISLIYCDDDCPQLCDTTYAAISILDDCTNFMQPDSISTNCIADTIYTCVKPGIATELCPDCSYATTEYFINDIRSISNAAVEVKSGNCLNYTVDAEFEVDSLIVELCSWEVINCVEKLFVIEIDDCDTEEVCPQIFACTPPVVEKRICLDCESTKFPNAVITNIQSKFDECVINLVDKMCFDYIPLPLMNILETDTALITYCDELTNICYETDVIISYSNCDGGGLQVVAANDYFEAFENEAVELPVLANDENSGSAVLNIAQTPSNGQVFITEDQVIQYTPVENFVGNDQFVYEICTFATCYQAEVLIEVYPEHRTLQQKQLIRAYPNPASNQITIEFELKSDIDVWIEAYNPLGKVIYETKSQSKAGFQKYIIDVTQFNKGIYFFNVSLGFKKQSLKILVD